MVMRPFERSLTSCTQRSAMSPHGNGAPSTVETLYSGLWLCAAAGPAAISDAARVSPRARRFILVPPFCRCPAALRSGAAAIGARPYTPLGDRANTPAPRPSNPLVTALEQRASQTRHGLAKGPSRSSGLSLQNRQSLCEKVGGTEIAGLQRQR